MSRLLVTLLFILAAAPAAARDCAVSRIEGESVRVWSAGTWSPLGTDRLPPEAVKIETDEETRVEIRCDDGVVVTVGVATELNIEELATPDRGAVAAILQLVRGIVGVVAPDPGPRRFEVRTPLAIASVRSTAWLVEHARDEGTAVFVRDGQVAVNGSGARVVLDPGEGITITADGEPGDIKTWGPPRIRRSVTALGLGWQ